MKKIILMIMIFVIVLTGVSYADKWNKLTFSEDVELGFAELERYCALHDLKVEDVFWANGTAKEEIKSGDFIYLPANQLDMLSLWQNKGVMNASSMYSLESISTSKKLPAKDKKSKEPEKISEPEIKSEPKVLKQETAAEKIEAPKNSEIKLKQEQKTELKAEPKAVKPEFEKKPEPKNEIQKNVLPQKQPLKRKQDSTPEKVIESAAKPDKILTAKPKTAKNNVPGLMDPIIILSPNGDPTHGPMRLLISGDKVEVVSLPQNAMPKKPALSDLEYGFGATPSYLPHYNLTARPRKDNTFIITNYGGKMMWPVDGKVSSFFGRRGSRKHEGIDIPMPAGTPIRAAKSGVVSRSGDNSTMGFRGYGNFILLDHGSGLQTFYAHCLSVVVREGQRVMQGQIIGYVGNTGRSTANHLHFEVRVGKAKVDPMPYLSGNAKLASKK